MLQLLPLLLPPLLLLLLMLMLMLMLMLRLRSCGNQVLIERVQWEGERQHEPGNAEAET